VADLVVAVVVKYCGIKNKSENFFLHIFVVVVVAVVVPLHRLTNLETKQNI